MTKNHNTILVICLRLNKFTLSEVVAWLEVKPTHKSSTGYHVYWHLPQLVAAVGATVLRTLRPLHFVMMNEFLMAAKKP